MPEQGLARPQPAPALRAFMERERSRVELALDDLIPAAEQQPPSLHRAMRHSVFAGGKRLRPLLVIAGGQACGARPEEVLPAACALELIHTYSLIHDDLPAFDDEELRRGKPTCHVLFGVTVAILAGDALQALAFEHMAQATVGTERPATWLRAIALLGAAAGSVGMCGGQTLDIEAPGQQLDIEQLRALHAAKTGALLTAAVLGGGIVAGADETALTALRIYGDAVGLAFQIVDDLLDVEGDVAQLGKQPGGDANRGQPTFPSLVGVEAARAEARQLREKADDAVAIFGEAGTTLRLLAAYIVDRSN